ncbi:MAG: hypothetical protein KDK25_12170 [Leptospiraceae bacterium]|nr:hypothetical protein [Leptospiraceae bacterium]
MRSHKISRYAAFSLLLAAALPPGDLELDAFSGAGPETHFTITRKALQDFAADRDISINPLCGEMIRQYSVISDSEGYAVDFSLHCDNDRIPACAYRLDELKFEAVHAVELNSSLRKMGMALHLIQDFYAHSNWVENARFTMFLAPIEAFSWFPPPENLQTGLYPEFLSPPEQQLDCYLFPVEDWGLRILGATHGCMNKDSEKQFRGITVVPGSPGISYHRLAAEYAKLHSVEFLNEMAKKNPWFKTCFLPPSVGGVTCSGGFLELKL